MANGTLSVLDFKMYTGGWYDYHIPRQYVCLVRFESYTRESAGLISYNNSPAWLVSMGETIQTRICEPVLKENQLPLRRCVSS